MQYFEDFSVGQKFASGRLTVDAVAIKSFAREYDPQPFHLDDEAARESLFGGLAASGFNEVAVSKYASVTFGAITGHRVAEPISMAAFSSGMLTLAMLRRGRRRR